MIKPKHKIIVLLIPGLTNFWGCIAQAKAETCKQKFSAGGFCVFTCFSFNKCVQASFAGLFDIKKKEASLAKTKAGLIYK